MVQFVVKSRYIWKNWRRKKRKMKRRRRRKKNWDRQFYIQACWYIQTCVASHTSVILRRYFLPHKHVYTQSFLRTKKTVAHKHVYIHTFLHTDCFTHKHFYTKTFLHTDSFAHKLFYTFLVFTHKNVYTQTLVCRNTSRHNRFYTLTFLQTRLHANASTHRPFDANAFTHNPFTSHISWKVWNVPNHQSESNRSLVGGIPTPLKNDRVRQLGWWHSQLNGKS